MVSRRTYFAITTMVLVICFLFLLPQFVKEESNPYYVNSFAAEEITQTKKAQWIQPELRTANDLASVESYAVFLGDKDTEIGHAVTFWAEYSKMPLAVLGSVPECAAFITKKPDVILIDPDFCCFNLDLQTMEQWNEEGITLIFCKLPTMGDLRGQYALREFLGIRKIERSKIELSAIHLFAGFLLGGERIYGVETEQDRELMDLNLEAAWITLRTGTETYLQGELPVDVLPEQNYRNEKLPALLWRRSRNGSNIFVVNGDYIADNLGAGFLSAMMAEDREYYLYPIVNSQVFTVADFPSMADENRETIISRYGRGMQAVVRDLLWPSMESMSEISGFPMSCFLSPQYDYQDDMEPDSDLLSFFLKLMKERNAEAGMSLNSNRTVNMAQKLTADTNFLTQNSYGYSYRSAYTTEKDLDAFCSVAANNPDLLSVSLNTEQEAVLFRYLDEDTLSQGITHDLLEYSDYEDLKLLSEQTALGYTNILLDMNRVTWPEESAPGWEVYYEKAASVLNTYWRMFSKFDRLTVSGSDSRVRSFLSMDYRQERHENIIAVEIDRFANGNDFILRTHKEDVVNVTGGSFKKLEADAWLIHADQANIEIQVELSPMYHS